MKNFLPLLLLFPVISWAVNCEVDGISDSPQGLSCYISHGKLIKKLDITCKDGRYTLRWEGQKFFIDTAYHEDVATGSSPLVFVSLNLSLKVTKHRLYHRAELVMAEKSCDGLCFVKR